MTSTTATEKPPKPTPEELFEEVKADWQAWNPLVYVVHSRGGMTGGSLPPHTITRASTWQEICRAIADTMDAPGPVMIRFCRPSQPMASRWSQWSTDLEIGGSYFRTSAAPSAPAQQAPSTPSITVPGDPMQTARLLVADAEERAQRMMAVVLGAIKEERAAVAAVAAVARQPERPEVSDARTALELGRLQAEVAHFKAAQENPPATSGGLLSLLATPAGAGIADRVLRVVERFAHASEVEAAARSTAADAALARAAAAAGLEVGPGEAIADVAAADEIPAEAVAQ